MTQEPDPILIHEKVINFTDIYNSDLTIITEEMLEFLRENDVEEEWLLAIMQDLYICDSNE